MPAYMRRMSTAPGGSTAGSGRCTMLVAARKSVERRCTSITRVLAAGRAPSGAPAVLLPAVAQAASAGSTRAATAAAGISTARGLRQVQHGGGSWQAGS